MDLKLRITGPNALGNGHEVSSFNVMLDAERYGMDAQIIQLKIRSLIADKEWATACANMETSSRGAWSCDWYQGVREAEQELEGLFEQLAASNAQGNGPQEKV